MPTRTVRNKTARQRCAICGKAGKLVRTECCGQLVCGPVYNRKHRYWKESRCMRGHSRYTVCPYHYDAKHSGDWKTCARCRADFEPEMYVWLATNEFNTSPLENPPPFEPTYCAGCGTRIRLPYDAHGISERKYYCAACIGTYLYGRPNNVQNR